MTRQKKELYKKLNGIEDFIYSEAKSGQDVFTASYDDIYEYMGYLKQQIAILSHCISYDEKIDNEMYFELKAKGAI